MQRLFFALTFTLIWVIGNANFLSALLLGGILGSFFDRPASPEASRALGLVLFLSGLIIPVVAALLILWLARARRFLRSSSLSHRVLELGILLSCIRMVKMGTLGHPIWNAHQEASNALHVVSGYALPVLVFGLALVFLVGKRSSQGVSPIEQRA